MSTDPMTRTALIALAAAMVAGPALAAQHLVGAYVPHDGDSGALYLIDGRKVKIRLAGIDAPETGQTRCVKQPTTWACRPENRPYGPSAARRALQLAKGQATCTRTGERPSYSRQIVTCVINGRDLGSILVSEGLAISERNYGDRYRSEEGEARRHHRGVWK